MKYCQNQIQSSGMDAAAIMHTDIAQTRRGRRKRTVFSRKQSEILNEFFKTNMYPGHSERERIAAVAGLDESRVQVWLQNKRARIRSQLKQGRENMPLQLFEGDHVPQESRTYKENKNDNFVIPAMNPNLNYMGDDPGPSANMNNVNGMSYQNAFFPSGRVFQDLSPAYVNQAQSYMYDHQVNYPPSHENIQGTSGYINVPVVCPAQPPQGGNEYCLDFPAILSQGVEYCPGNAEYAHYFS